MGEWTWSYEGYDPARERLREALCTLGNGYFATRAAAPETTAGPHHYPGTYAAGCYNRLDSTVAGRTVRNEDLVNLPNWLPLRFRIRDGGTWFTPDDGSLLEHRQDLDLRHATLTRTFRLRDPRGRILAVEQTRLVHMSDPHLAALRTVFRAEGDWSGELEVESALDGAVANTGVARYRALNGRHLTGTQTGTAEPDTVWLRCRTTASDIRITLAARTRATPRPADTGSFEAGERTVVHRLTVPVAPDRPAVVEKTVALHTSRDRAIGDPLHAALDRVGRSPDFRGLLASHAAAWERLWHRAGLDVPGEAGRILRLHTFHVLQTLSPHTAELDVGVPARGLHGEAYRGHVFWDELFVLPYLDLHFPEVSRALLEYRHRRLGEACLAAERAGRTGAMYPWQSGSDGREETQTLHLNPRSGRWLPDHTRLQHHVGSAVAYNIWRYAQATGDTEFLHTKGAEMLLQIARFWACLATWDPDRDSGGRYRIRGVVGPDEYHDAYPDSASPGIDDNAYTNLTAAWVLDRALHLWRTLPAPRRDELRERMGLAAEETDRWEDVSHKLYVPWHAGVISQFAGYGELEELDWEGLRARYGDIRRLDRILEAEGDCVNRYQASKQADVLMLGFLFPPGELHRLLAHLGYELDDSTWRATVEHYLRRTSHGSTLSAVVHAWVLARTDRAGAWSCAQEALLGDVTDIQGGTTEEGVHLGAMAGTLDLVQRGLTGLEAREDALWLDPAPLPQLSRFALTVRYRGHWGVRIHVDRDHVGIAVPAFAAAPVRVRLDGRTWSVAPGRSRLLDLPAR
ncbi:glycoside hydrolase family 65 protein [Actinacidiphila sp. bgisy167]|uniref:glycoside hydrolase family 65 protein n=1 Tax=Actinacidiphila sp. bgisy167 TaxID=3413797 RepID=UPI003D751698